MDNASDEANTLVFEYHGNNESTKAVFNRSLATLSEASAEVTGFRIELTTTDSIDPFDALIDQQSTPEDTAEETNNDQQETSTESTNGDSDSVPTLQSDALPAQVLSRMLDRDDESVRTNELKDEFESDDIDTARLSQTLASLKRRELVAAEPDPEDKRANIYWPTERGEKALTK
ncbi:MarR family transcriptional regulator [Halorussus salinus]|uniref:MarR family transcriptional regulator n=1 Tax=Halorussus salinus TaxID=1364935 RepID=UPI0010919F09|nr:helix-turn-helix domain-containing protein [Halorussus salinus]